MSFHGHTQDVFSTYVEVIPRRHQVWVVRPSVLHVCGGDPTVKPKPEIAEKCSPRMWR